MIDNERYFHPEDGYYLNDNDIKIYFEEASELERDASNVSLDEDAILFGHLIKCLDGYIYLIFIEHYYDLDIDPDHIYHNLWEMRKMTNPRYDHLDYIRCAWVPGPKPNTDEVMIVDQSYFGKVYRIIPRMPYSLRGDLLWGW